MNVFVGNKLKKFRKSKSMSQEEVADFLHLSQSAYARMESGESHSWANHILKICQLFEINAEELLRKDDIKESVNYKAINSIDSITKLSDKVIEQYEERIKELKEVIEELKSNRM